MRQPDQINGKLIDGEKGIKEVIKAVEEMTIGDALADVDSSEVWDYNIMLYGKNAGDNQQVLVAGDKVSIDGIWHAGSTANISEMEDLYDSLDYVEQRMR